MFPNTVESGSLDAPSDVQSESESSPDMSMQSLHDGDELDGKMDSKPDQDRLAHSVIDMDMDAIDEGMLVDAAFNNNKGTFMPDMMFKDMVRNFKNAEKLYGQTFIRQVSGYDPRYIEKNIRVPEFQKELEKRIETKAKQLQDAGLLKKGGSFTDEALLTAALFLIDEEFEKSGSKHSDFGEPVPHTANSGGEKSGIRPYRKGDTFRDVALKHAVNTAIRRGRNELRYEDLASYEREAKQQVNIIYALDVSGSMKGNKLGLAKRAGVALANRALRDNNKVGLVLFDQEIKNTVPLTSDLLTLVRPLVQLEPGTETDLALAMRAAEELLVNAKGIKHVVLITDGVHTSTRSSKKSVIKQVLQAVHQDISVSLVGIHLDDEGLELAKEVVDAANGKLYAAASADDVGGLVIADYMSMLQ